MKQLTGDKTDTPKESKEPCDKTGTASDSRECAMSTLFGRTKTNFELTVTPQGGQWSFTSHIKYYDTF